MAWFKKKRTSPILIADLLYQNFVEEHSSGAMPEAYRLPEAVHERFRQKVLLYREANVLLALWILAKQDPLFEEPLHEYERLLFPQSPEAPGAAARLQEVRAAGGDLQDLTNRSREGRGELTWGRNWFADIGHDETNPVALAMFSQFWLKWHLTIRNCLKDLKEKGMIA